MDSIRFYGMSILDMEFLKQWSGMDFDIGEALGFAFTMSSDKGADDYNRLLQANYLWRASGRDFPISVTDRVFPPKAPHTPFAP